MSEVHPPSCAVVVNSCDKYAEVWPPFFQLLQRFFPDCPFPVYLNTEHKDASSLYDGLRCMPLTPENARKDSLSWSERLLSVLERVEEDFVLCLLDDFFLQAPVDLKRILWLSDQMNAQEDIAVFYLKKITGYDTPSLVYPGFSEMKGVKEYKFSCQAALWRKSVLMEILRVTNSPWDFETGGPFHISMEGYRLFSYQKGLSASLSDEEILPYIWALRSGYGVWQSKWLWGNRKMLKKFGIPFQPVELPMFYRPQYWFFKYVKIPWRGVKYRMGQIRDRLRKRIRE